MVDPYVGFMAKEENDFVSFTIVRYAIPLAYNFNFPRTYSINIESFSSETNVWTANKLILDVPVKLYPSWDLTSSSSAGVVDGVFCWLDNCGLITVYDRVKKSFWVLELPVQILVHPGQCCLVLSGGKLYLAMNRWKNIIIWNFPSRDNAVWVNKYAVSVAAAVQRCDEDFGLGGGNDLDKEVQNMFFHSALLHVLYLQIRGKVISYDLKAHTAELVYDFGGAWRKTHHYKFFSYEWPQWPRRVYSRPSTGSEPNTSVRDPHLENIEVPGGSCLAVPPHPDHTSHHQVVRSTTTPHVSVLSVEILQYPFHTYAFAYLDPSVAALQRQLRE
ncbi:putative proteasome subunit beta type-4-like [Capsicum annuum]|nr:putative proteasome subunit beta type-4-like [Capsicum annuum]KAF3673954.1 putative proteasome subunit beta type-4-like [Capsicum annuum]